MSVPVPGPDDPGASDRGGRRPTPLFLQKEPYQRRRVMDAARLLPALGAALILLPVLWEPEHSSANAFIYLFLAWLGLIAAAAYLSRRLSDPLRGEHAKPAGSSRVERKPASEAAPPSDVTRR